jgi:hypothetical protein
MSQVCAAVFLSEEEEAGVAATLEALDRQTRAADARVVAPGAPVALRAAAEQGAEWVWLLDGSALPEPAALERLLEALDRLEPLPSPILLASKVVGPDGSPDPGSLPAPRVVNTELAAAAAERRVLPVRIVRHGSLLVHRRALPARASADRDLAWSAGLLRDEAGYMVPASVAVREAPRPVRRELGPRLRLLAGGALARGEKPRFALRLAEEAAGARRGGRARSRPLPRR